MKKWYYVLAFCITESGQAQDLSGTWQGVEIHLPMANFWPAVLTLKAGDKDSLSGVLFQEVGNRPAATGTFDMRGTRTPGGCQLAYARIIAETNMGGGSWCLGSIDFTYDAAQEKLTGRSTFRPLGSCNTSSFELFRVRLKSAATVQAGTPSILLVSGREVKWYADAAQHQLLTTGNRYRTTLTKPTTFYLTQDFYPNAQRVVTRVAVGVRSPATRATKPRKPLGTTGPPVAVVLPTVIFRLGTAELLPEALPALDALATRLKTHSRLRLRLLGHTDRIGEASKNLLLSAQRAQAVRTYLVRAGVADTRLEVVGRGDTRPLYPAPDDRNRRVEIEEIK